MDIYEEEDEDIEKGEENGQNKRVYDEVEMNKKLLRETLMS